ncbi:hypothetical protein M427DRAFT_75680 [Gonapodya prolifera JEL478]|uniref:BTB domain-containing protein n=1 Tax=Gonapodya prolifera (strain JEL478) TaxID=1344416 RepID=A0A138ZXM4_GONPJ|nr:hypothetical protein M427DRAFT_75680 [Gonapodya prolifera JEL478]|eukprot:KXS09260.1 hypothetical protein M427DRAFT_75680 [Gonapodya prolifera JEL478]
MMSFQREPSASPSQGQTHAQLQQQNVQIQHPNPITHKLAGLNLNGSVSFGDQSSVSPPLLPNPDYASIPPPLAPTGAPSHLRPPSVDSSGSASTSPVAPPQVHQMQMQVPPPQHHDVICHHMYNVGFVGGHFSDLVLRFQGPQVSQDVSAFRLHRIVVAQSPYIAQVLRQNEYSISPLDLVVHITDPHISHEGLHIALGHLYASYSLPLLAAPHPDPLRRSALLRSALASACLLHLPDLATRIAELVKLDIRRDTVTDYCAYVGGEVARAYGPWAREIRDAVTQYLCRDAAREAKERTGGTASVWEEGVSGEAYRDLVAGFAELPFDWLKKVVESRGFDCPSDLERFNFAKEVLAARVRAHRARPNEENVLLAFGGKTQGQANVALVRRTKSAGQGQGPVNGTAERKVWKAGGE